MLFVSFLFQSGPESRSTTYSAFLLLRKKGGSRIVITRFGFAFCFVWDKRLVNVQWSLGSAPGFVFRRDSCQSSGWDPVWCHGWLHALSYCSDFAFFFSYIYSPSLG